MFHNVGDEPAPVKAPNSVVKIYDPEYIESGLAGNDVALKAVCWCI